ncbi:hypothetical protein EYF80_009646 [Liparis tanakae]|uniref:Uncharacterized protein n=1 Tax=Liparis tanakae TaxID=230148 RepID=A0A4Z2IQE4_9TELE|nr:hypothetical protein EYF80_009646 [Liparis tanakae]
MSKSKSMSQLTDRQLTDRLRLAVCAHEPNYKLTDSRPHCSGLYHNASGLVALPPNMTPADAQSQDVILVPSPSEESQHKTDMQSISAANSKLLKPVAP